MANRFPAWLPPLWINHRMLKRFSLAKMWATHFLALLAIGLCGAYVFAWFDEGHEIIAIIAADNLKPDARAHVAQILRVPADEESVAKAIAAASIRPDNEFRADRQTHPWHYIDICLQDRKEDLPARCPNGACVTAKIEEYARRLKDASYDKWGPAGDLAFLIHFVGDIHQPLHAATNGDRGGTCEKVAVTPQEKNLHFVWDDAVVVELEGQLGTQGPEATAKKLEQIYPEVGTTLIWKTDTADEIAWETHKLAITDVYGALSIPEEPCRPDMNSCAAAPIKTVKVRPEYLRRRLQQLAGSWPRLVTGLPPCSTRFGHDGPNRRSQSNYRAPILLPTHEFRSANDRGFICTKVSRRCEAYLILPAVGYCLLTCCQWCCGSAGE